MSERAREGGSKGGMERAREGEERREDAKSYVLNIFYPSRCCVYLSVLHTENGTRGDKLSFTNVGEGAKVYTIL